MPSSRSLQAVVTAYGQVAWDRAIRDEPVDRLSGIGGPAALIARLASADPSPKARNLTWLVHIYATPPDSGTTESADPASVDAGYIEHSRPDPITIPGSTQIVYS